MLANFFTENVITGWEFQDYSVTRILREITFGEYLMKFLEILNFVTWVNFSFPKLQNLINQNSEPLNVLRWQILRS